jgi:hypothetical protein
MRIFYILLSIILLTAIRANCQVGRPVPDPDHKVIKFYPNPCVSYIIFELAKEDNKTYNLEIYSFIGRKVKDVPDAADKTTVQLSDLPRGIYIFQLKDETGRVTDSGRFQVNK